MPQNKRRSSAKRSLRIAAGSDRLSYSHRPGYLSSPPEGHQGSPPGEKGRDEATLIKSHVTISAARAQTARAVTGFPVFGGLALNWQVGGLNKY